MSVSAVDVGLHNMGIVTILPDRTPSFALRVNIQKSGESRLGMQVERTLYDNMHNLGEHVVIERQPPMGMQAIMELLIYILEGAGKTVSLVNPNTLHKYYGMPEEYEARKERAVAFALRKGFGTLEILREGAQATRYGRCGAHGLSPRRQGGRRGRGQTTGEGEEGASGQGQGDGLS
jgi:hypothetical protein